MTFATLSNSGNSPYSRTATKTVCLLEFTSGLSRHDDLPLPENAGSQCFCSQEKRRGNMRTEALVKKSENAVAFFDARQQRITSAATDDIDACGGENGIDILAVDHDILAIDHHPGR